MAKDNTDKLMDMLLAKKRAGDRREWLETQAATLLRSCHERRRPRVDEP